MHDDDDVLGCMIPLVLAILFGLFAGCDSPTPTLPPDPPPAFVLDTTTIPVPFGAGSFRAHYGPGCEAVTFAVWPDSAQSVVRCPE